jgi:hypothetical protein
VVRGKGVDRFGIDNFQTNESPGPNRVGNILPGPLQNMGGHQEQLDPLENQGGVAEISVVEEEFGDANRLTEERSSLTEESDGRMSCSVKEHEESEEEENFLESEQEKEDEMSMGQWKEQADQDAATTLLRWQRVEKEPDDCLMDPFDLDLAQDGVDGSVHESNQIQCGHTLYNLESYEMVERAGWSWMKGDTVEKECCQCHKVKKLPGWNPMYYCWACHDHRICKAGCWSTLLLSDGGSGRGQRKNQCRRGKEDITGDLGQEESKEEDDSIGSISVSTGKTGHEMEEFEANEREQVMKLRGWPDGRMVPFFCL